MIGYTPARATDVHRVLKDAGFTHGLGQPGYLVTGTSGTITVSRYEDADGTIAQYALTLEAAGYEVTANHGTGLTVTRPRLSADDITVALLPEYRQHERDNDLPGFRTKDRGDGTVIVFWITPDTITAERDPMRDQALARMALTLRADGYRVAVCDQGHGPAYLDVWPA